MARSLVLLTALVTSVALQAQPRQPVAQPTPASVSVAPEARTLFERDWVLMNWALKYYDFNHNILLEPSEAAAAADGFRQIADTNHDGRIVPEEYRAARALILAKY